MKTRILQLTFCWHLVMWRGGSRLAIRLIRSHVDGRPRTIGATLNVARITLGVMRSHRYDHAITRHWYRDFGRFSIGGWRNGRTVPVSTGWMVSNPPEEPRSIIGASVTVASRTLYLLRLHTRAEYRAHYAHRPLLRRIRRKP